MRYKVFFSDLIISAGDRAAIFGTDLYAEVALGHRIVLNHHVLAAININASCITSTVGGAAAIVMVLPLQTPFRATLLRSLFSIPASTANEVDADVVDIVDKVLSDVKTVHIAIEHDGLAGGWVAVKNLVSLDHQTADGLLR